MSSEWRLNRERSDGVAARSSRSVTAHQPALGTSSPRIWSSVAETERPTSSTATLVCERTSRCSRVSFLCRSARRSRTGSVRGSAICAATADAQNRHRSRANAKIRAVEHVARFVFGEHTLGGCRQEARNGSRPDPRSETRAPSRLEAPSWRTAAALDAMRHSKQDDAELGARADAFSLCCSRRTTERGTGALPVAPHPWVRDRRLPGSDEPSAIRVFLPRVRQPGAAAGLARTGKPRVGSFRVTVWPL
jgi:hypothetical protein